MDDALPMGILQCPGHLPDDPDRLVHRQLLLAGEPLAERLAADQRHDIEEDTVSGARIVQRQDMGMLQVGGDLDLPEEPLRPQHGGEFGLEHLDRHLPVVPEVAGQVHGGHAALAELPLEAVAASQGGVQLLKACRGLRHASPVLRRRS
jgi:hypothetical protein